MQVLNLKNQKEQEMLDELLASLTFCNQSQEILKDFNAQIVLSKRADFHTCIDILLKLLKEVNAKNTKAYKIADKSLSSYEEQYILERFLFFKHFESLPQWFKDLY